MSNVSLTHTPLTCFTCDGVVESSAINSAGQVIIGESSGRVHVLHPSMALLRLLSGNSQMPD